MGIRLVAVTNHGLTRMGLAYAISSHRDIELIGDADSTVGGRQLVDRLHPDVVAVDTWLPDGDGLTLAGELRGEHPQLGIVLLAPDDSLLLQALEIGLSGYLTRQVQPEDVVDSVRHAAVAPTSFTAPQLDSLIAQRGRGTLISRREQEVLRLMWDGTSLPRIAETLQVSEATVKTYVARIYRKLRVRNRVQALTTGVRLGLIPYVDLAGHSAGEPPSERRPGRAGVTGRTDP